jgi:serine/threonine protein kinase
MRTATSFIVQPNIINNFYQQHFIEIGRIGKGGFGTVFRAISNMDDKHYAIKKICFNWEMKHEINREIQILGKVCHSNIAQYYNSWIQELHPCECIHEDEEYKEYDATLFIQMEDYSDFTLRDYLDKRTEINQDFNLKIFTVFFKLTKQLTNAVQYIHQKNILHLDIKPENIFIKDGNAFLGDFGSAIQLYKTNENIYEKITKNQIYSSSFYEPPEDYLSPAFDVYSLGVVLFELFVLFYTRMERAKVLESFKSKDNLLTDCVDIRKLIQLLLKSDPLQRPNTNELKSLLSTNYSKYNSKAFPLYCLELNKLISL